MVTLVILIFLYSVLQLTALPGIATALIILHRRRRGRDSTRERLGFAPASPAKRHVFWLHACSVGEVLSLQELITSIKEREPKIWVHVTVGTPNGRAMAEKHLAADRISYLPYDMLPCMLLAYARIRPSRLVITEAEWWPMLFWVARLKKVPIILINARISARSAKRMLALAPFLRTMLAACTRILTQHEDEIARFKKLGVDAHTLRTLGNIKAFNVQKKRLLYPAPANLHHQPVLLAGSIHPTEETVYLELFKQLKPQFPSLKLILVPRHFHWQEQLVAATSRVTSSFALWAANTPSTNVQEVLDRHDILLVCRLGELFQLYPHATLFFLGGTFVPVGGHNLLEPAVWHVPSIVGPYQANCQDILQALRAVKGSFAAATSNELALMVRELLSHPQELATMREANKQWIKKEAHRVEHAMRQELFSALFSG